ARTAAEPSTRIAAHCSAVGWRSAMAGLVLHRRRLVATDGPIRADAVAGVRIDVEAAGARARDEVADADRDRGRGPGLGGRRAEERSRHGPDDPLVGDEEHDVPTFEARPLVDALDPAGECAEQVHGDLEAEPAELLLGVQEAAELGALARRLVVERAD